MSTPLFTANPVPLSHLLSSIEARKLALPDFQRDFVWEPTATVDLLCTLERGFPAGSLLFIRCGSDNFLEAREFSGAPGLTGTMPAELVLDGQQRLTSLYGALYGRGEYRFFVDVKKLRSGASFEESLFFRRASRLEGLDEREQQAAQLIFPLAQLFSPSGGFIDWSTSVAELAPEGESGFEFLKTLQVLNKRHFEPIATYAFPVVSLPDTTPPEAVCKIFSTINSTGVRLTTFDLLAAKLWPEGFRLRREWTAATEKEELLHDFLGDDGYAILQAIAVRSGRPPTPTGILQLTGEAFRSHWETVLVSMTAVLRFLRDECGVRRPAYLPYGPALVPLAATWDRIQQAAGPERGVRRTKLARWFWCSSFGQRYEVSASSRVAQDYKELVEWLEGRGVPRIVDGLEFNPSDLLAATRPNAGLYRATLSLILRHGARDFHSGELLSSERLRDDGVDDHHVVPTRSKAAAGHPDTLLNTVLNRALIDPATNKRISNKNPSVYIREIEQAQGPIDAVLESHLLPAAPDGPLRKDDLMGFLEWRQGKIAEEVRLLTGWQTGEREAAATLTAAIRRSLQALDIDTVDDSSVEEGYRGFSIRFKTRRRLWIGVWDDARRKWLNGNWTWVHWSDTRIPVDREKAAWATLVSAIGTGRAFIDENDPRALPTLALAATDPAFVASAVKAFVDVLRAR
ncbi:MAG TPA: DUF262 domain-containing protein [Fimbriimonadaceae bacterium]|nr:DUF262 domain-containing protein [Fimbriimonadaceae bacterium]